MREASSPNRRSNSQLENRRDIDRDLVSLRRDIDRGLVGFLRFGLRLAIRKVNFLSLVLGLLVLDPDAAAQTKLIASRLKPGRGPKPKNGSIDPFYSSTKSIGYSRTRLV
jgi:hypothetical protein